MNKASTTEGYVRHPWRWLGLLWLSAFVVRATAGMVLRGPYIFGDEFDYWDMARSFARSGHFQMYHLPTTLPNVVYPLFIAPAFFARHVTTEYVLVRILSALLMASVVFPAYGLAREFVSEKWALIASLLVALSPAGMYASTVMAENLFFPWSVLTLWMGYRTLAEGRWQQAIATGLLFSVGFFVKIQQMFLVVAYFVPLTVWVLTTLFPDWSGVRRKAGLRGVLVRSLPVLIFAVTIIVRWSMGKAYGYQFAASVFGEGYTDVAGFSGRLDYRWFLNSALGLFGVLSISTLFAPMAAALCAPTAWREMPEKLRLFWWLTMSSIGVYVLMVARHNALHDASLRVHERYVFVVTPLLWTLFLAVQSRLRLRYVLSAAVLIAGVCAWNVKPYLRSNVIGGVSPTDSATLTAFYYLHLHHGPVRPVSFAVILAILGLLGAYWLHRRKTAIFAVVYGSALLLLGSGWYLLHSTYIYPTQKNQVRSELQLERMISASEPVALVYNSDEQPQYLSAMFNTVFWLENPVTIYVPGSHGFFYAWERPLPVRDGRPDLSQLSQNLVILIGEGQLDLPLLRAWTEPRVALYRNDKKH